MAIKILDKGFTPHFRSSCLMCGCYFEFDWVDMIPSISLHETYAPNTEIGEIICPCCKETISVYERDKIDEEDTYGNN